MKIASPPTSNLIETKSILPMRFQVVLFAIVRMIININTRMVYPFLSTFASGLGVDLVSISLAMTVRSISGAFSLFITPLADQRGRKTGMLLGVAIFIVGAALVTRWAWGLLHETGRVLLDAEMDAPVVDEIRDVIAASPVAADITDLHVWRVGKGKYACILALSAPSEASPDQFRRQLGIHEELVLVTIELNRHQSGTVCA